MLAHNQIVDGCDFLRSNSKVTRSFSETQNVGMISVEYQPGKGTKIAGNFLRHIALELSTISSVFVSS